VTPWSAFFIGGSGGIRYAYAAHFINDKLKIDDPLEAISVHCVCGFYGPIMTAAFAKKEYVSSVYGEETAETTGGGRTCRLA
jgi:ammonium transporter, Amt family